MINEIITLKTAKLAKEKGFDRFTEQVYWTKSHDLQATKPHSIVDREESINAPLQSFLQRWLREKHNIIVSIIPHFYGMSAPYTIKYNYRIFVHNDPREFDKYEDCLEIGLQEGLSEIKT